MLGDLLLADLEGLLLPALVQLRYPEVIRRGDAHHIAQGLDDGGVHHHVVAPAAIHDLKTFGGLHNDFFPGLDLQAVGGEIIALSPVFESYANYFNQ